MLLNATKLLILSNLCPNRTSLFVHTFITFPLHYVIHIPQQKLFHMYEISVILNNSVLDLNVIVIVLSMFGKFWLTVSYSIIYIFSAELFPTPVRNVGLSIGSCSARVGGILAPYITKLVRQTCIIYHF